MLRQFSPEIPGLYERFKLKGNTFASTIHVLVSAVVKLAQRVRLPSGLKLYRGLGSASELPQSFYESDAFGRCGYMEYGFLSTTSDERIARQVRFQIVSVLSHVFLSTLFTSFLLMIDK